jgi:hypothetical protein
MTVRVLALRPACPDTSADKSRQLIRLTLLITLDNFTDPAGVLPSHLSKRFYAYYFKLNLLKPSGFFTYRQV